MLTTLFIELLKISSATTATSPSAAVKQPPYLTDVPIELIGRILNKLDFVSRHKARGTCHAWSELVPPMISCFGDLIGRKAVGLYKFQEIVDTVPLPPRFIKATRYDTRTEPCWWRDALQSDNNQKTGGIASIFLIREDNGDNNTDSYRNMRAVALINGRDIWRVREVPIEMVNLTHGAYVPIDERISEIEFFGDRRKPDRLLLLQSSLFAGDFGTGWRSRKKVDSWADLRFGADHHITLCMDWRDPDSPVPSVASNL